MAELSKKGVSVSEEFGGLSELERETIKFSRAVPIDEANSMSALPALSTEIFICPLQEESRMARIGRIIRKGLKFFLTLSFCFTFDVITLHCLLNCRKLLTYGN